MAANSTVTKVLCAGRRMFIRLMTVAITIFVICGSSELADAIDPGTARAMAGLGLLYEKGEGVPQDYKKAAELYEKAALSGNVQGQLGLAGLYIRGLGVQRDAKKAAQLCEEAIRIDPNYYFSYLARGSIYTNGGDYKKALVDFDRAAQLNPKASSVYHSRGLLYTRMREYDNALADLNQAIRLDPKNSGAYQSRSSVYLAKDDYGKAIADCREAMRLDPKDPFAYNSIAWIFATCAQPGFRDGGKAIEYATKACELSKWREAGFMDTLGAAYAEAGDFGAAIKWGQKAVESTPVSKRRVRESERLDLYRTKKAFHEEKPSGPEPSEWSG